MRLRTLPFGIIVSDVVAGKDGCDGANDGEDGEAPDCGSVDVPDGGLGGLPEPGHRADSGPWVLIKPEVMVERDLKQTAQTPAVIFLLLNIINDDMLKINLQGINSILSLLIQELF